MLRAEEYNRMQDEKLLFTRRVGAADRTALDAKTAVAAGLARVCRKMVYQAEADRLWTHVPDEHKRTIFHVLCCSFTGHRSLF
jgi:hypothetical protein